MGFVSIAGLAISAFGLLHNLIKDHNDLSKWEKSDLEVELRWLDVAIEKGFLDGKKSDYKWPLAKRVSTMELHGYQTVWAINKDTRSMYRLVAGQPSNRHVLVQKVLPSNN